MQLPATSLEYVRVPVASSSGGVPVNPTADPVQMAFPLHGVAPVASDWQTASWETDATVTPNVYYARLLVGPGQLVLPVGAYDCWVAVTDNPEIPVRKAGMLTVV